ncbi:FAD/NAD(P)-binding protein [Kitasatospora sp. NPDC101447]|uniref:FAD/NAD(P)-binding protein n=1 Tax=Kitasatospora sp. NPDC101447 TaxID=3364102 RepID=UPI0037FC55CE
MGVGPRGLILLERLCANAAADPDCGPVTVHAIDPTPPGAGRVWRTDQSPQLLMNTVAEQITVFTDASVVCAGPVVPGPNLYEWARALAGARPDAPRPDDLGGADGHADCGGDDFGPADCGPADCGRDDCGRDDAYPDDILREAGALGPNSYPTRPFYGHYLRWAFRRAVRTAPPHVTVRVHRDSAVALEDFGEQQLLRLAGGDRILLDAVVLAQGHLPTAPGRTPAASAATGRGPAAPAATGPATIGPATTHATPAPAPTPAGGRHLPPGNPAEVDTEAMAPGEPVAVRGLGLAFFDYLTLLTQGRGGVFEQRADGRLDYRPSGREPRLYAGSRRGLPYRARGENQKELGERHRPLLLTGPTIRALRERAAARGDVRFRRDVWPLIAREVEIVYYRTLLSGRDAPAEAVNGFLRACLYSPAHLPLPEPLLRRHGITADTQWNWRLVETPYDEQALRGRREFGRWLAEHLDRDAAAARGGNVDDPVKAALDALRDLRNEIRQVVDHAGITGRSYREELTGWFSPFNAGLSIGPPGRRIAELAALVRAGVVTPLGPGMRVAPAPRHDGFLVSSATVPGPAIAVTTLIEARIQDPDVRTTADRLLRGLLETGQAAPYRIPDPDGGHHETGALAVTERPSRLVDARGRVHPRRYALGVPTEGVHWATAAGVRPGVDSVTLGDADAVARALLDSAARHRADRMEALAR